MKDEISVATTRPPLRLVAQGIDDAAGTSPGDDDETDAAGLTILAW